jgi:RIO kinase 1
MSADDDWCPPADACAPAASAAAVSSSSSALQSLQAALTAATSVRGAGAGARRFGADDYEAAAASDAVDAGDDAFYYDDAAEEGEDDDDGAFLSALDSDDFANFADVYGGGGGAVAAAPAAAGARAGSGVNAQPAPRASAVHAAPAARLLDRFGSRVSLAALDAAAGDGLGGGAAAPARHTGRDDRATVEQVLDPRTRLILFKLLNAGVLARIHGCVSTGKEANVYHAVRGPAGGCPGAPGAELAIKIYKTSILVFKDRDRYVAGEFRFASGYARGNPRKMVKLWAEKETRNLKRLHAAGLPCPAPLLLRMHVLIMDFVGAGGAAAPRLKDAALPPAAATGAYLEVADLVRAMFQRCRLVHADLSEYNLLWHGGHVVVIDVSQSVERDHPRALEFLRADCTNVTDFFAKRGVAVMSPRDLFDFAVHAALPGPDAERAFIEAALARAAARAAGAGDGAGGDGDTAEDVADAVFMSREAAPVAPTAAALARGAAEGAEAAAAEAAAAEAAARAKARRGDAAPALPPTQAQSADAADGSGSGGGGGSASSSDDDASSDGGGGGGDDDAARPAKPAGAAFYERRGQDAEARRAHKAAVKEEKREKRKTKVPKSVKKSHAKEKR